jgi:putative ABC transport system permease protein
VELTVALRMAFRALGRNKMRTALTMLGVIIGVAAVICTVSIGEGASERIQTAIAEMGANMVWIEAGSVNVKGVRTGNAATKTLTLGDAKAIGDQIPLVSHVTPNVDAHAQVVFSNQNWYTQTRGISPNYLYVKKLAVERGTFFGEDEIDRADNVCVLGRTVAKILFLNDDPIGQTIRVANNPAK